MVSFRRKSGLNVSRVVGKLVTTVLASYVGGQLLTIIGQSMIGTCSPFFSATSLIGWKVGSNTTFDDYIGASEINTNCACLDENATGCPSISSKYILYDVSDAGITAVLGLIGLGLVVTEFIEIRL